MRFDSLSLVGFKSFANKTQVSFDEQITAIVGPNGCGKSNLFDALSWVLGAQKPREMRGQKMEDFIFGGTGKRKQSGLAQASLGIRLNGTLDLEIQGKTITDDRLEICRKLYRSGENSYFVNGRRCRLKDIHRILEEVGLDCASYALIAQGKIDSFMTAKPLERRAVIEEAARITGYKSRRRRAELKLDMAQQNLLRVTDIILEVERRLRSLKRQAAEARRYKLFREEFRDLQRIRFVVEARRLQDELQAQSSRLDQYNTDFSRVDEQLQDALTLHQERTDLRNQLENELAALSEHSSKLLLEIDRTTNAIRNSREQIEATGKYTGQLDSERASIEQAIHRGAAERGRFQKETEGLCKEEGRNAGIIEQHRNLVEQCSAKVGEVESAGDESRNRILELSARMAALTGLLEQIDRRLEELQGRETRLAGDQARAVLGAQHLEDEFKLSRKEVDKLETKRGKLQEKLTGLEAEEEKLDATVQDLKRSKKDVDNQLIALAERLQSLLEIDIGRSQYSGGVQKLLVSLTGSGSVATGGTLADRIETKPEFEQMVENFLDNKLEYVLVDSMRDARAGLEKALSLKGGRCSFLTLRSDNGFGKGLPSAQLSEGVSEGVVGTLSELLMMDAEVESAFRRVLPETANAVVVSDLEKAFELAHYHPESTFLTLDGATLAPRGLLTANLSDTPKLGLLSLKRSTKEAEEKAASAQRRQKRLGGRLRSETRKLASLQLGTQSTREDLATTERTLWQLGIRHEQLQSNLEREMKGIADLNLELQEIRADIESSGEQKSESRKELTTVTTDKLQAEKHLAAKTEQLAELRGELDRVQQQFNAASSNHKILRERKQAVAETLTRIGEQLEGFEARRKSVSRGIQQNRQQVVEMAEGIERMSEDLSRLNQQESEATGELTEKRSQYQGWKSEAPRLDKDLDSLRSEKDRTQQSMTGVQVEVARIETQLQGIEDQSREQLQESIPDLLDSVTLSDVDPGETLERYAYLKERLEKFGPINMTALEEYQESEERYNFLSEQRRDLEASISDTQTAIQDLNRRSREQFKEAFTAVNRNFKKVFRTLFGGGKCGMKLLDEDDLLESGLEIFAQPPGKRLQNVMLLSGGEKALTVFALLVGLFEYRPSQFCVLDEVDAPLDDANVARFTKLLRKMSDSTQIIVVTHNKQTMEMADTLFGVTMEEPGVSEIVSVRM